MTRVSVNINNSFLIEFLFNEVLNLYYIQACNDEAKLQLNWIITHIPTKY